MAKQKKSAQQERQVMSAMERLSLRVSSMINHPVAQLQRWVTIHRLDDDGEREWEEVLTIIAETDELELTLNDDGSVTVRWEEPEKEGRPGVDEWEQDSDEKVSAWEASAEAAPF